MDKSVLVKMIGFPATLIHGDTLVKDRWVWLKRRLPMTANGDRLIDLGCGTGAFTIGASLRGYRALGLSWDDRNQAVATERASMCKAETAQFDVLDVRQLHERVDLRGQFDVAVCLETIEHIMDDRKLFRDIVACLKPGGRLLLTTPHYYYRAITKEDNGPFCTAETGWHVRRGYTHSMLTELCSQSGLVCEEISYCSGFVSQKVTAIMRVLSRLHPLCGWVAILPLRIFPISFDKILTNAIAWPEYSICLSAYKPRYDERIAM